LAWWSTKDNTKTSMSSRVPIDNKLTTPTSVATTHTQALFLRVRTTYSNNTHNQHPPTNQPPKKNLLRTHHHNTTTWSNNNMSFPGAAASADGGGDDGRMLDLSSSIETKDCFACNEAPGFPMSNLFIGDSRLGCKSDADEQLILHVSFHDFVKVRTCVCVFRSIVFFCFWVVSCDGEQRRFGCRSQTWARVILDGHQQFSFLIRSQVHRWSFCPSLLEENKLFPTCSFLFSWMITYKYYCLVFPSVVHVSLAVLAGLAGGCVGRSLDW
jgi:hypothetical protein